MFHKICRRIVFPIVKLLYRMKVKGLENLPKGENFIIVSNHLGIIDCFAIAILFKQKIYFMAKKELFNKKLKAKFIRWLGGIPVDREKLDITTVKECFKTLKNGDNLVVFPEGTRNKKAEEVDLLPLKGGANLIAFKTGYKIVPVGMAKKYRIFRKNHMYIGEAYDYSNYKGQKLSAELSEELTEDMRLRLCDCIKNARKFAEESKK
ncbi:MAG: 1-acyl-sn-glycerol-3-phosphate acyltransferase [Clostridia bacterium]|nr:1-acyl-sn-glycerol-3-phosphate acyltransferase [Clostridia bacterium]